MQARETADGWAAQTARCPERTRHVAGAQSSERGTATREAQRTCENEALPFDRGVQFFDAYVSRSVSKIIESKLRKNPSIKEEPEQMTNFKRRGPIEICK